METKSKEFSCDTQRTIATLTENMENQIIEFLKENGEIKFSYLKKHFKIPNGLHFQRIFLSQLNSLVDDGKLHKRFLNDCLVYSIVKN